MIKWVVKVFSENGDPSFARVASASFLVVILALVVFLTLKDGKLPDLSGLTLFTTGVIGILYGTTRVSSAFEKMSPPKDRDAKNG